MTQQLLKLALTWPMAIGLAAVLLAGLALLVAGWRGRRVNDHPICRACGFDLIGIHPGGPVCPECGRKLDERRAVRPGLRRRRWIVGLAGLLLALSAASAFGWFGYSAARAYDWNRAKPVWYILREIKSGKPVQYARLMDELARRADGDTLSAAEYRRIVPLARDRQRDLSSLWDPRWGHLVETGFDHGRISDYEFNRYLEGLIQATLKVRKTVQAGAVLPAVLSVQLRGGTLGWFPCDGTRLDTSIAGRPFTGGQSRMEPRMASPDDRAGSISRMGQKLLGERTYYLRDSVADLTGSMQLQYRDPTPFLAPDTPGLYTFTTKWRFVFPDNSGRPEDENPPSVRLCHKRIFERDYTSTFTVVPSGTSTVKLVSDPARAAAMAAAFDPRRTMFGLWNSDYDRARPPLQGRIDTGPTPAAYAFDVFARISGGEVFLGSLTPIPDDPFDLGDTRMFMTGPGVERGAKITYILRPSPKAAELTTDLEEIWGEEIQLQELSNPEPGELLKK